MQINFRKGFTVLELLIVITVILILLAIALAGLNTSRERARDNRRVAHLREIMLVLEQYRDVCGDYPRDLDLTADYGCRVKDFGGSQLAITLGDFIDQIPTMPGNSTIEYIPLKTQPLGTKCVGYHIGVNLEGESFSQLDTDDDQYLSPIPLNGPYPCTGGSDFDGEDPVYDFIRPASLNL